MIRVAVGVLKRNDTILVAKRAANKPYSGYWEFPGGKIEPGETSEAALRRELQEELGIEINDPHYLFSHTHHYPDKTVLLDIWVVSAFQPEPHCHEHETSQWVSFEEMLALRLLEGNWAILDKLKKALLS